MGSREERAGDTLRGAKIVQHSWERLCGEMESGSLGLNPGCHRIRSVSLGQL
jgi:hypothetical protein